MKKILLSLLILAAAPAAFAEAIANLNVQQTIALQGICTPAQITSTQNNYNPTDVATSATLATSATIRLFSDAARSITGIAAGRDGELKAIINTGSFVITLSAENSSSTAANRFGFAIDYSISSKGTALLQYDGTASRWRIAGGTTGVGGLLAANNLSDVASVSTSRTNLGLGTLALQAANSVAITGGTIAGLSGLAVRDTSAAFDLTFAGTSSTALTAGHTLTFDVVNGNRVLSLAGNVQFAGAFPAIFNIGASTSVLFPATGTLATLIGAETFSNKTIVAPKISTSILDINGNILFGLSSTASAAEYLQYANAASGGMPTFTATGGDTNIGIVLAPKGNAAVTIAGGAMVGNSSFIIKPSSGIAAMSLFTPTTADAAQIFLLNAAGGNVGYLNYVGAAHALTARRNNIELGSIGTLGDITIRPNDTERARFFASGRIALGSSTDDGTNELQVTGATKITGALTVTGHDTIEGVTSTGATGTGKFVFDTAPTIAGGTHTAITGLGIRSTGAAFDLTLASAEVFTAGRTLTFSLGDAARTLTLSGNPMLSGFTATGTGTLALGAKNLTVSNTLTLAGTDSTVMTFPSTSATIARTDAANTFTGHQTIEGVASTGATGTGKFVFDGSPTITGLSATAIAGLGIRDTSAAFDVTIAATSSTPLTAGRTLTLDLVNAARTLKLSGNATLNQDVSSTASPTFVGATFSGALSGITTLASSGAHTTTINGINQTSTDALVLQNTTAATVGNIQWSPAIHWISQTWQTGSGTSQTTEWKAESQGEQASSARPLWVLSSQSNGGGWLNSLKINAGTGTYTFGTGAVNLQSGNTNQNIKMLVGNAASLTTDGSFNAQATTASTSTTTGSGIFGGGIGVTGNIYTGGLIGFSGDWTLTRTSGSILTFDNGNSTHDSILRIQVATTATGNPILDFFSGGVQSWRMGQLTSDGSFRIDIGSASLGTNTLANFAPQITSGLTLNYTADASSGAGSINTAGGIYAAKSLLIGTSIKTGAPSGGTAAAWKMGIAHSVSPTSPNRTVELDVAGTIYYLAAKTTDD